MSGEDTTPIEWALRPLKRFAVFSGRAPRAEYWWYVLLVSLISFAIGAIDSLSFKPVAGIYGPLTIIWTMGLVTPGLAVTIRRLHDSGHSGWWCLLKIGSYTWLWRGASPELLARYQSLPTSLRVPLAGVAIVCGLTIFTLMLFRGDAGPNRYGPDPYGPDELEQVFA